MSKNKQSFRFPMTKAERIIGILYIPIHGVLLVLAIPLLCEYLFGEMESSYVNLIYYSVSLFIVLVTMFKYLRASFSDIFDSPLRFLKYTVLAYVMYFVLMYVFSTILTLIDVSELNPNTEAVLAETRLNSNVMIVVGVLFAPIVEETIFRGALFGTVRQKSRLLAYIVSALVFALYHLWQYFFLSGFSWSLMLYLVQYIPAAFALAWCYEKSGSIWSSILLHAAVNYITLSVSVNLNL